MEYKYWNQLDYPEIPYGDGTVASSGCGLCSACMVVENLTDYTFTPAEAVALAYDKTVFYKKELNWRYLNGILRRWNEQGWHTAEEIRLGDGKKPTAQSAGKSDLDKYMKW